MEQEPSSIRSTRLGNNPIAVRQPSCQCTGFDWYYNSFQKGNWAILTPRLARPFRRTRV